jgi:hypothetical protein
MHIQFSRKVPYRAGSPSRSLRQQSRRIASLELEGEPTVKGRRYSLSASRKTIASAWGAGRMRTEGDVSGSIVDQKARFVIDKERRSFYCRRSENTRPKF